MSPLPLIILREIVYLAASYLLSYTTHFLLVMQNLKNLLELERFIFHRKVYHLHYRKIIINVSFVSVLHLLDKNRSFTLSLNEFRLRLSQSSSTLLFNTVSLLEMIFLPTINFEQSFMWNIFVLALKFWWTFISIQFSSILVELYNLNSWIANLYFANSIGSARFSFI